MSQFWNSKVGHGLYSPLATPQKIRASFTPRSGRVVRPFPRIETAVTSKPCMFEVRCGHGFEPHLQSFLYNPG